MWAEVLLAVLYILPATSAIETPVSLPELPQERLASLGGRFTSRSGSITSSLALPRPTWSPLVKHHVNLSDPSLLIVPTPTVAYGPSSAGGYTALCLGSHDIHNNQAIYPPAYYECFAYTSQVNLPILGGARLVCLYALTVARV